MIKTQGIPDNERPDFTGQTVTVISNKPLYGQPSAIVSYRVEGYWDVLTGGSWMDANGNPACIAYAVRSAVCGLPTDDLVLYGKTPDSSGHLVHVSEVRA